MFSTGPPGANTSGNLNPLLDWGLSEILLGGLGGLLAQRLRIVRIPKIMDAPLDWTNCPDSCKILFGNVPSMTKMQCL